VGDDTRESRATRVTNPDSGQNAIDKRDYGHARELRRAFAGRFRWIPERKGWTRWIGGRWKAVPEERVFLVASRTLQKTYEKYKAAATDEKEKKRFKRKIREACMSSHINGGLKFLAGHKDVLTSLEQFDRKKWLLNVQNGTLNLHSLKVQEYDAAHLMTKTAGVSFEPDAGSQHWDSFIYRILPNANVRRYVQRQLGKAMAGAVLQERLDIWWGTGANGKTTLARVMLGLFGDYARRAAPSLLIASRYERHPTEIADLAGSRLVFSVEVDQGKRLAEALVKDLTGGDRKKARFMRQDFFEFEQTFDIVLIVNHKPVITGTDPGVWRRIRLVPFEVQIPQKEQRAQDELIAELLKEGAAILNWLIEGLRDYHDDPKWMAEEVSAATDAYRDEMDHIGKFIADHCEVKPRATVEVGKLYIAYQAWCAQQGEDPLRKNQFGSTMRERGYAQKQLGQNRQRAWVGLRLIRDVESPVEQK